MVQERGLSCGNGNDGCLTLERITTRSYSVGIEKKDFDAACAVDYLGDVALHSFYRVHCPRADKALAARRRCHEDRRVKLVDSDFKVG